MKAKIYNNKGKESGQIELPNEIFGLSWNDDLVHQVVTSMLSTMREPVAHTKSRGEVSGTGKKPWRQKGTGRARHGSRRSPIWVGGGITFGPRNEKNYERKVNKKMKSKALATILSKKMEDGEILFVDSLSMTEPKTKEAKTVVESLASVSGFENLAKKRKNTAVVALAEKNINTEKSFSNFGNISMDEVRNINPVDILNYKYLIIENPEKSLEILSKRFENLTKAKSTTKPVKTAETAEKLTATKK